MKKESASGSPYKYYTTSKCVTQRIIEDVNNFMRPRKHAFTHVSIRLRIYGAVNNDVGTCQKCVH